MREKRAHGTEKKKAESYRSRNDGEVRKKTTAEASVTMILNARCQQWWHKLNGHVPGSDPDLLTRGESVNMTIPPYWANWLFQGKLHCT
jgi:hypothetical protein